MKPIRKFFFINFISLFLILFSSSIIFAAPFFPLKLGYTSSEKQYNSEEGDFYYDRDVFFEVSEKFNASGEEWFLRTRYDTEEGLTIDTGFLRSTEDSLYVSDDPFSSELRMFTTIGDGLSPCLRECPDTPSPCSQQIKYMGTVDGVYLESNGITYNDVLLFNSYKYDGNEICSGDAQVTDQFWFKRDVGLIKSIEEVGIVKFELTEINPPNIDWAMIRKQEYENGNEIYRFGFGLGSVPPSSSYGYGLDGIFHRHVPANERIDDLSSILVNGDSGNVPITYAELTPSYISFCSSDGIPDSEGITTAVGDFQNWVDGYGEFSGSLDFGNYTITVTDVDSNLLSSEVSYAPFESIPIIPAYSFSTSFETPASPLIPYFKWEWSEVGSWASTPNIRAAVEVYDGEEYKGLYWINVKGGNFLTLPYDNVLALGNRANLRIQTRYGSSLRRYSNNMWVPILDDDGDGISNDIDVMGINETDFARGATVGTITDRSDKTLSITKSSETSGVLMNASCASPSGECLLGPATIEVCEGDAIYELLTGDEEVLTECGSVITQVINGVIGISFVAENSTVATTEVGAGNGVNFEPETVTLSVPASNTTPIEVEFNNDVGEPVATVEIVGDGDPTDENENSITFEPESGTFTVPESNTVPVEVVLDDGTEVSLEPGDEFLAMDINIRPLSRRNTIFLWRWSFFPVAILSNPDLDATSEIDRTSITFGHTGDEDSLAYCFNRARDINKDGIEDLTCLIRTSDTGFEVGDTVGILKCETLDGILIQGSDLVRIIGR
jgi:hypothetical protein